MHLKCAGQFGGWFLSFDYTPLVNKVQNGRDFVLLRRKLCLLR
jgi:hypothetical protein